MRYGTLLLCCLAIAQALLPGVESSDGAKFGESSAKIEIKTGSYPGEQRWLLYKTDNFRANMSADYYEKRTTKCPGKLDGDDTQPWDKNKPEAYSYLCMQYLQDDNNNKFETSFPTEEAKRIANEFKWLGNPMGLPFLQGDLKVGSSGRYTAQQTVHTHTMPLEANTTYRFKAIDTYGDGWNGGYWKVSIQSNATDYEVVVPATSMTTGFVKDENTFRTKETRLCRAGYYCPTALSEKPCGNYTVYCPEGSRSPKPVSNSSMCASGLAIAGNYSLGSKQTKCSTLTFQDKDGETSIFQKATQPETKIIKLKLTNTGEQSISWSCLRENDAKDAPMNKLRQRAPGNPAWTYDTLPSCFLDKSTASPGVEWLHWNTPKGFIEPGKTVDLEVGIATADLTANNTYKGVLNISYVTPSKSGVKPPMQTVAFNVQVTVNAAQSILVFPFELSSNLKVGEKETKEIYVFNIGDDTEFGVHLTPPQQSWAEMDNKTFCSNSSVKDLNELGDYCKVKNDRTFQKYDVVFNAQKKSARAEPYESSIGLETTQGETVDIRLIMSVSPGEPDASKSTVSGIQDITVRHTMKIAVDAKDSLGGATTSSEVFFLKWEQQSRINGEGNEVSCKNPCASGTIETVEKLGFIGRFEADFFVEAYGNYTFTVTLRGDEVGSGNKNEAGKYFFQSKAPNCGENAGTDVRKESCRCKMGHYLKIVQVTPDRQEQLCLPCAADTYKDEAGDKDCQSCPKNAHTGNKNGSTSLDNCRCHDNRTKTNDTDGGWTCPCNIGFGPKDFGKSCRICEAGRRHVTTKDTDGKVVKDECKACEKGEYQPQRGNISCIACEFGKYTAARGSTSCRDCDAGRHQESTKQTECKACEKGKYNDQTGQKECKSCEGGHYQKSTSSVACNECEGGKFQPSSGKESCLRCESGLFVGVNDTGAANCTTCPRHHWTCSAETAEQLPDNVDSDVCEGQTKCSPCPAGTEGGTGAKFGKTCNKCPEGKYSKAGQACQNCEGGKYSNVKGATECLTCLGNEYSPRGSAQCSTCPSGLVVDPSRGPAEDTSSCVCDRGFFLYPQVLVSVIVPVGTGEAGLDTATKKEKIRSCLGLHIGDEGRKNTLRSGLPIEKEYEKIKLDSIAPVEGGRVKANFKIFPETATPEAAQRMLNLFNSSATVMRGFANCESQPANDFEYLKHWKSDIKVTSQILQTCEACPQGGLCTFGTVGETTISALPGYWRPKKTYARFWECPIPSKEAGKFKPWVACYGGVDSKCGPVFQFDKAISYAKTIKEYLDEATWEAMPDGEFDYTQELVLRNGSSDTMDYAIVKYLNSLARGTLPNTTEFLELLAERKFLQVKGWSSMYYVGDYSGPLCTVCPPGTGRDGNFQSGTVCTPCPAEEENIAKLVALGVAVFAALGLMVASQVTKGSMEKELMDKLAKELKSSETPSKNRRRSSVAELLQSEAHAAKHHREMQLLHGSHSGEELSHKQILTGMFRILAAYLQVTALAKSVPVEWPDEVKDVMMGMETVSSPSLSLTSVDCAISSANPEEGNYHTFYKKFYAMMMVPLLSIAIPGAFFFLYYLFGSCILACTNVKCWPNRLDEDDFRQEKKVHKHKLRDVETLREYNLFRHRNRSLRRFKVTVMVVLFLFYTTICKSVVEAFACRRFGESQFLIADLSIDCASDEYLSNLGVAILCFFVYCIGIPFAGYLVLRPYIDGIHYNPKKPVSVENPPKKEGHEYSEADKVALIEKKATSHGAFGFLWQGLSEVGMAPYWEVTVISIRKLLMICIIMLMTDYNPNIQMTVALLVLFTFTILHVNYRPYDAFVHGRLEFLSLLVSQTTLFIGLLANFFKEEQKSDLATMTESEAKELNYFFGLVIVFVNMLFLGYFVLSLIFHSFFMINKKKRLLLEKYCGCFCRCCRECQEKADDAQEKMTGERPKRPSYHDDEKIKYHESDLEMSESIEATQQSLVKLQFEMPRGVNPGDPVYVNSPAHGGKKVKVVVPYNTRPGQLVTIMVPVNNAPVPPSKMVSNPIQSEYSDSDDVDDDDVDDDGSSDSEQESHLVL